MAIVKLKGRDADDKEQGRAAYYDAELKAIEARAASPGLGEQPHLSDVADVAAEIANWLKVSIQERRRAHAYYENPRKRLDGCIKGPGTSIKFGLSGKRNFTPTDAQNLHNHLSSLPAFKSLKINVADPNGKAVCVVHVGL